MSRQQFFTFVLHIYHIGLDHLALSISTNHNKALFQVNVHFSGSGPTKKGQNLNKWSDLYACFNAFGNLLNKR